MVSLNWFGMSAFGICLAVSPVIVGTPSAQTGNDNGAVFVPLVDACVSMPTVETCQQVRAVITECASDLDEELCAVLFEEPTEVFDTPARLETSQAALSTAAEAISAMEFSDVPHEDFVESARADAERILLRGDENLMSHSAPPNLEGDAPPADQEVDESNPAELIDE